MTRMKLRTSYAILAVLVSIMPAAAEPLRMAQAMPAMLPAHEIAAIVRSAGFTPISPAMRRGEMYVLRAIATDGREMRVVINARRGEIVSSSPVVAAAPVGPRGERLGPGEPIGPPGYIPPGPPGVYEAGPPVVYEGDRPLNYERRPQAPIPNAPPRTARANPPDATDNQPPADAPPNIMREERGEHGLLPPPPERFPQRVAPPQIKPAAKPAPVKRAAAPQASAPPLPKPRPEAEGNRPAEAGKSAAQDNPAPTDTGSPAVAPAPAQKPDPRALPH